MLLLPFNIQINSPFQNVDSNLNINIPFSLTSFHKIDSLMNAWKNKPKNYLANTKIDIQNVLDSFWANTHFIKTILYD
jgi:hypothetical protein